MNTNCCSTYAHNFGWGLSKEVCYEEFLQYLHNKTDSKYFLHISAIWAIRHDKYVQTRSFRHSL